MNNFPAILELRQLYEKAEIAIWDYWQIIPEYQTLDDENNPINKYIENAINLSYTMKLEILKQKSENPESLINIANTLSLPGLLESQNPTNEDYKYILSLIGKILENNGITVGIYQYYDIKDRIDLASIQLIFSGLINKKKFKLFFNVSEDVIITFKVDLDYKKKFIDNWKNTISNRLNINKNLIILTNSRKEGQYLCMDLAFNPEVDMRNENFIKQKLVQGEIINCQMIPLLEGCRLSPGIFDSNFNKYYDHINQGVQKRGGEDYISPLKWTAYGINVLGKYDFGDNRWLSNDVEPGEYAVAYYGINNLNLHNILSLMGNLESGNTFVEDVNLRNPGQKCMSGAYFYKNPSFAENSSEIINIGGFEYKIMFMCRVNPSKIRQPQNFPDCWILSPTPDEIRPYKILIKKIPKSPLAIGSQQTLKMYFEK